MRPEFEVVAGAEHPQPPQIPGLSSHGWVVTNHFTRQPCVGGYESKTPRCSRPGGPYTVTRIKFIRYWYHPFGTDKDYL